MSNILSSNDFGLKIYNRFPPKYREDDIGQNFALKRYLESLADGGFKYSIDEINGIANLVDPDKVDAKILPVLFQQYGLDLFNGIPEEYLRYLLPKLGEAWSKKGTLSVIDFMTSSLSGVKTSTRVTYDTKDNPFVEVRFEMDYTLGDYFPNNEQFNKLLTYFLPFYCDKSILYSYTFDENRKLKMAEISEIDITDVREEEASFSLRKQIVLEDSALLGEAILGKAVLGVSVDYVDTCEDSIVSTITENTVVRNFVSTNTLTNSNNALINSNFCTNGIDGYDIVRIGGNTELVIY